MKKSISLILCLALLLSSPLINPITVSAASSEEQYLITKGVPEEIFADLSEETIHEIYEVLYGEDKILLSAESSVIADDKLTRDTISANKMRFSVMAVAEVTTIGNLERIDDVFVIVTSTWTEQPTIKWTDKIAVNWDSSVLSYQANSFSTRCYSFLSDGSREQYHSSTTLEAFTQGGLGYGVPLTPAQKDSTIESVAYFTLLPANGPIYKADGYSTTTIGAEYAHDKNLLTHNFDFTISGVFVSIAQSGDWDSAAAAANIGYIK